MEVRVLGGARQVGRSAFLVNGERSKVLLDFGVLTSKEPAFPVHVRPKDIDGVILSHAHLDHSGAIPLFFLSGAVNWFSTPPTAEIARLLIEDFIKISGFYLPFEYIEVLNMMGNHVGVGNGGNSSVGEFQVHLHDAGHIPGSSYVVLGNGRKRLLYTGDVNTMETKLLNGASIDVKDVDIIITEGTYSQNDHPERSETERSFVEFAREVVESGGTLLVPAFSVGRAQELACILRAYDFPYPVAMDGMALKVNGILTRHQEYLKDPRLFRRTIDNLELVTSWEKRKRIVKTPSVIISPAGMLVGGASIFYSEQVAREKRNAIAIVSFQASGTPGRTLLEKGITLINGKPSKVKARVRRFALSAHCGRKELFDFMKKFTGQPKVLVTHGEEESCVKFADELKKEFNFEAYAPKAGESFSA